MKFQRFIPRRSMRAALVACALLGTAAVLGWMRQARTNHGLGDSAVQAGYPEDPRSRLLGQWIARDVPTLIGGVKIEMNLRENGSVHVKAWSKTPVTAQLRDSEGAWTVEGDWLKSELLKHGPCKYWFDSAGHLMVQYKPDKIVAFARADSSTAAAR